MDQNISVPDASPQIDVDQIDADRPSPGRQARDPLTRVSASSPRAELPRFLLVARTAPFALGGRCRWPLWGDERPTHRYCDAPRALGRPYCAPHCRVAYPGLQRVSRATEQLAVRTHWEPHRRDLPDITQPSEGVR